MNKPMERMQRSRKRSEAGFTLVELMVAIVLGLVVLGGLITLLVQTNQANRVSSGVARMQENARFALEVISSDIRQAGSQYCSNFDNALPVGDVSSVRALRVHFDAPGTAVMPNGLPDNITAFAPDPAFNTSPFPLSPAFFIRGYECDDGACVPDFTVVGTDASVPPDLGTTAGLRPLRSDVLTMRYISGPGVSVTIGNGGLTALLVDPPSGAVETDLEFQLGDLLMVSDCDRAEVFPGTAAGTLVTPDPNIGAGIQAYGAAADARVFNFSRDFRTVTYYLRNRVDPDTPGRMIPVLMRQINGVAEELVEGIERLDFRYLVDDANGVRHIMTANQVQNQVNAAGAAVQCQQPPRALTAEEPSGCLWRSVVGVEVSLLANSVENVLSAPMPTYTYSFDDVVEGAVTDPMPHGLPAERVLRREFVASVAVRAFTR